MKIRRSGLLCEAGCTLIVAKLVLMVCAFRRVARWIGCYQATENIIASHEQCDRAVAIAKQVKRVADHLPFSCVCLPRAMATQWMLARRRIPSMLVLGVAKSADQALMAHAWVSCGEVIVIGGEAAKNFTIVATFARGKK